MRFPFLLNQQQQTLRSKVDELVKDLHALAVETGNEPLTRTVNDLRNRLHEPFMFVIVGEVKSGKSSFINALLDTDKEVCKVSPAPMTDTIQQIVYGAQEEVVSVNPYLKKLFQPVEILREIAIVDTPGTNTIVAHHQEITESFIPASDLIVFVFEAKNPYRQSAWDFFQYIHNEWHRKVIFVLQQKDLMSPGDLDINEGGVRKAAVERGISEPLVFSVSAKLEQEGQKDQSGYAPLRQYIRDHITGGKAPLLKLRNNLNTSATLLEKIMEGMRLRREQWVADQAFRKDIHDSLENQERKSLYQVDQLVELLGVTYDRHMDATEEELNSGLSFFGLLKRSFTGLFSKKASAAEWLNGLADDLAFRLNADLKQRLQDGVTDIADSIQQMAKLIDLKLKTSPSILQTDSELFADIAERRANVLRELQETYARFLAESDSFKDKTLFGSNTSLTPNVVTGSGVAVIGLIFAAVTQGMVFDITGGLMTGVGLLFAGASASIQRKKIVNGFRKEANRGRERIALELGPSLRSYVSGLRTRIERHFDRFDEHMQAEAYKLELLEKQAGRVSSRLEELQVEAGKE